jgi:hypothetical protein
VRGRLDEELGRLERAVQGEREPPPELLVRLGRLYMRADRAEDAAETFARAREALGATLRRPDGGLELNPLTEEVDEALAQVRAVVADHTQRARRRELVALLEAGELDRAGHDELIRLEVAAGVEVHPEEPTCPACEGPTSAPAGDGTVACGRSGRDGDLCRHTDAKDLYACETCGLVVRLWREGKLRVDAHEPPLVRPDRSRCRHCDGRIASWKNHFMRCPKARPADFPICPVCDRRGFHAAELRCPRCRGKVAETLCGEPRAKRRS